MWRPFIEFPFSRQEMTRNPQKFHFMKLVTFILLHEKFLQYDWLRAVVFQLHLKYIHVKITNLLWVVV